jgi:hypothetical protein
VLGVLRRHAGVEQTGHPQGGGEAEGLAGALGLGDQLGLQSGLTGAVAVLVEGVDGRADDLDGVVQVIDDLPRRPSPDNAHSSAIKALTDERPAPHLHNADSSRQGSTRPPRRRSTA